MNDSTKQNSIFKVIGASSLGTLIEWYDFYIFGSLASIIGAQLFPADAAALSELGRGEGKASSTAFVSPVKDFYMTNPIARASRTMAECSAIKNGRKLQAAE